MLIAGALAGLAGAPQILGTSTPLITSDIDAGIGFDAITVALLGRGHARRHGAGRPAVRRAAAPAASQMLVDTSTPPDLVHGHRRR